MKRPSHARLAQPSRQESARTSDEIGRPLVWTFDGSFAACLADIEDTLRRAIVQVGDIAAIAVLIEISLPALKQRVDAGQSIQPSWRQFVERLSDPDRYGLPAPPRLRHVRSVGPLATLVLAYRS
jgi:hypothetical protein